MAESLTADGLLLALETVRVKWERQGAQFAGELAQQEGVVAQPFTFDDQEYEVSVFADKSVQVAEVDGEARRAIRIPRGLPFPKGFRRTEEYHRSLKSTRLP